MARRMGVEGPLPIEGATYKSLGAEYLLDCFQAVILEAEAQEDAEEEAALGHPSYMSYAD